MLYMGHTVVGGHNIKKVGFANSRTFHKSTPKRLAPNNAPPSIHGLILPANGLKTGEKSWLCVDLP